MEKLQKVKKGQPKNQSLINVRIKNMKHYCNNCGEEFKQDELIDDMCPYCGSDDIEGV